MRIRILFIIVLLIVVSCRKNKNNPIPNIPFDITININLPAYSALSGVGGYAYVAGGSKGIIVYRRSLDEFVSFDRHSPVDLDGNCPEPLYPDSQNFLILIDSCFDAKFSLYDGSPIAGSDYGLRAYQTTFNGTDLLRIFN